MNNNDASNPNDTGVSRRVTLTLAAGVAALGVALGMRSDAFAQGKGEGKLEGKGEGKAEGKGDGKAVAIGRSDGRNSTTLLIAASLHQLLDCAADHISERLGDTHRWRAALTKRWKTHLVGYRCSLPVHLPCQLLDIEHRT